MTFSKLVLGGENLDHFLSSPNRTTSQNATHLPLVLGRNSITPFSQAPVNTITVSPPRRNSDQKTTNQNNVLRSHIVKISIVPNTKLRTPKLQLPSVLLFASKSLGDLQPLTNAI